MPSNTTSTTTTVVATLATVLAARAAWSNTPAWVKKSFSSETSNSELEDANDDLANPATILVKIKETMSMAHELCADLVPDDMPYYKLYCCFMSMIHFMNELDAHHPEFRESYFNKDGEDVQEQEVETLTKYLDFAQWAYHPSVVTVQALLRPMGYKLIRHDSATEPGRVGHFIAVHHGKKQVVISIKGTSTLSDVFTDLVGKAVPHSIDNCPEIRCHEGMYVAAKMMLDDTLHLLQHMILPQDYKVIVCGHSLGAGVSCLLGIFLKQHLPDMPLQVYAFATPACCSYEASLECRDYITSVVNNNDCVPRMSLVNVRLMHKLFLLIDTKLKEKGLSPNDFSSAKKYLADLMVIDANFLMSPDELNQWLEDEFQKDHDDPNLKELQLYVPGKVVSIWNHTKDSSIVGGKVTNGGSQVLKQIFVEGNMVSDHSCDAYRQNLLHLLEQTANTI